MAEHVRRLVRLLARYFAVPSREGFSAYRTGWIGHLAFSTCVAGGIVYLGWRWFQWEPLTGVTLGFLAVWALWWPGVFIGVVSHYGLVTLLLAMGVVFVGPYLFASLALGLCIAAVAHAGMHGISRILKWLAANDEGESA